MRLRRLAIALAVAVVLGAAARADPPPLAAAFYADGLAALRCGESDLLAAGNVDLVDIKFAGTPLDHAFDARRRFDAATRTVDQTYPWGVVRCGYRVVADRLTLDVEVRNTGGAFTALTISPMRLRFPHRPSGDDWANHYPVRHDDADDIPVLVADWGAAELVICDDAVDPAVSFGLQPLPNTDAYQLQLSFVGGIAAGRSRRATISLRVATDAASKRHIADDVARRFAVLHPSTLRWTDRRPIGVAMLSTSAAGWPRNPRGWFQDPATDTTTDAGRAAFAAKLSAYGDAVLGQCGALDAQGVIVWDVEGQQMPHATSYVGDPRALPRVAPEMDALADGLFRKLAAAGLRTGVTLRPTRYVAGGPGQLAWLQVGVPDAVAEIASKIEYARRRWNCTLFYVDSDVVERHRGDGQTDYPPMPASAFATLAARYPDVLLIPEQGRDRYWANTARYWELRQGHRSTPPLVRSAYPLAFTVLRVIDGPPLASEAAALTEAVRGGDVLLFRAWWDDPDNAVIRRICAR